MVMYTAMESSNYSRERPVDGMFIEGLNLHKLVKLAFPERALEIVD